MKKLKSKSNRNHFLFIAFILILLFSDINPIMAQLSKTQAQLYRAIMRNDIALIDSLTSVENFNPNEVFSVGVPLLHFACMRGKLEVADLLVTKGADVNLIDILGRTPAKATILGGRPEMLEFLIKKNIKVNQLDKDGNTLLIYLLKNNHNNQNEIAKILIENGIDINGADNSGKTALVYAVINRLEDLGIQFIKNGADINWTDKQTKKNLLHYCAIYGSPKIMGKLIEKGVDVNAGDSQNAVPLLYALKYRHPEVAKLLVRTDFGEKTVMEILQRLPFEDELHNGQALFWNLNNRGWAIKTKTKLLVFDYEEAGNKPGVPSIFNGWITPEEIKEQTVISLYTCWHGYENEGSPMHNMESEIKNIQYVLNKDDDFKGKDSYKKMSPNETIKIDNFEVTSFRSDGITLGYLINGADLNILYTGFPDVKNMEDNLSYIKKKIDNVDVLLLSTTGADHDIESVQKWADYFISNFNPRYIIPKDNKQNMELYLKLMKQLSHQYPESKWFVANYPGDRRHIN